MPEQCIGVNANVFRSSWLYYSSIFVVFIAGYKNWLGPSKSEFGKPRKNSGKLVGNYKFSTIDLPF
jgi:hypothetical protein